jgi:enterobactin synthetase component D
VQANFGESVVNIVNQWLPKIVYCYTQVFQLDNCLEIMDLFDDLAFNKHNLLPENLRRTSLARQASYLAGRGSALSALKYAGCTVERMLGRTTQGLPEWPQGFMGSISHAMLGRNGVAVTVVARTNKYESIAIDCEPVFSAAHAEDVAPLTASMNEQRLGERLSLDRALWLTMVYSLKETLYKLLYTHVNCFMPFEAADVLSFDVATGQACLMLTVDWGDLAAGQRFWLKTTQVDVEKVGACVVSFGAV